MKKTKQHTQHCDHPNWNVGGHNVDLNKATGTGLSFASGGALIGAELAGLIGGILFAAALFLVGFAIVALIKSAR